MGYREDLEKCARQGYDDLIDYIDEHSHLLYDEIENEEEGETEVSVSYYDDENGEEEFIGRYYFDEDYECIGVED